MHYVVSVMLIIVGIIHFLPLSGMFGSVVAFLWLAWSIGGYNTQVARIVRADIVALVCLVIGVAARISADRG